MASAPISQPASQTAAAVQEFAAGHYAESGAARFGIDVAGLASLLAEALNQRGTAEPETKAALESLRLEELVLARACMAGHEGAWELFLTRYRGAMYEVAYKVARDEAAGRALADSLYAELYGLTGHGEVRASKLRYYLGRGSLAGWLRTVLAQEYINQYRRTRRETSLEAAVEDGAQFAASEPDQSCADPRVDAATTAELESLEAEQRFLLASYYLDRRTLAEIARLLRVHESTVSRKLERATAGLRKGIRKRLMQSGMTARQADEAMQDVDVRDLQVKVSESLRQDRGGLPFYKEEG
jgi:RNA polymerase sigma-70 factor (ECF subfamily)